MKNETEGLQFADQGTSVFDDISEVKIDPIDNFEEYLNSNNDAKEFYNISILTGDLVDKDPTELEKRQFLSDYQIWLKAGKPKPSMPTITKGVVKIPTAAYRIRDRNNDKMYIYYNDGTISGQKKEFFKKTMKDVVTGETIQTDMIDDSKKPVITYDLKFTHDEATKLLVEADKLIAPGNNLQLYFFHKGSKRSISEENFTKSYDIVSEMIEKKQSIN